MATSARKQKKSATSEVIIELPPYSPPPLAETLDERYAQVQQRIATAAQKSGRSAGDIILVAVTKYAAVDQIRHLIELGQQDFGESRVQNLEKRIAVIDEFLERHRQLGSGDSGSIPEKVRWHMIGHLQRNKARKVAGRVRLIHSVDSLRLVEELHDCTDKLEEPIEILIQVNVANEKKKFGVAPAAVRHLLDQIDTMVGLRPRGLMCMAPMVDHPEKTRPIFERCRDLFEEMKTLGSGGEKFNILSMGMSHDFEVAIECGANVVRIGSAIFGEERDQENA